MKIDDVLIETAAAAYRLTEGLPKSHPLADQLTRAANSAALNTSEGFAFSGAKELNFFRMAYGSLQEAKVAAKIRVTRAVARLRRTIALSPFNYYMYRPWGS